MDVPFYNIVFFFFSCIFRSSEILLIFVAVHIRYVYMYNTKVFDKCVNKKLKE